MLSPKEHFEKHGYCIIRGLLSEKEVAQYKSELLKESGFVPDDFHDQRPLVTLLKKKTLKKRWYKSDGVSNTPAFWPLIGHPKLVQVIRSLFGNQAKFLQHTDLHVGFSASGWHRDSVDREFGKGPEWENTQDYKLVRVGIYLQRYQESGFKLGVIPNSHRYESKFTQWERFTPSKLGLFGRFLVAIRYALIRQNLWTARAHWFAPEPGDAIIFDPRLLHTGGFIKGPKYSMFLGFGVPNSHFDRFYRYYQKDIHDPNYKPLDPKLVDYLIRNDLYYIPEEKESTPHDSPQH